MDNDDLEQNIPEDVKASVKQWQARVCAAKLHWDPDFKRMRENMRFVSGLQWDGQKNINSKDYVANIVLRQLRFKVAQLYAKNPTAEAKRRKRMDYTLWDESIMSLQQALAKAQMARQYGMMDLESEAVLADYMHGKMLQKFIDKVCRTLEIVYQIQVDASKPEFKEQMKQLVTRVVTCGVGYLRLSFVREGDPNLSTVEVPHSASDNIRLGISIADDVNEDGNDENDARLQDLRSLAVSAQQPPSLGEFPERIEFDFPPATSIIPDERCRALKEFVGARFVCQEYIMPLDEVNAMFGTDIQMTSQIKEYGADGQAVEANSSDQVSSSEQGRKPRVAVWNVLNYTARESFYMVDGYCGYARAPLPLDPQVSGFWPIFALTFNDLEVEAESGTSIFPPSDVDLVRHPQKEWNRTRDALRDQRNANAPKYLARKGVLTEADKDALRNASPNSVIELEGIPMDMEVAKAITVFQTAVIDTKVYDTAPLTQDMQMAGGMQEANVGAAKPDVTATVGTIAEQSRISVVDSNADDLDGFLSRIARAGGEIILQKFSLETVRDMAGDGAVLPPEADRLRYLNQVYLTTKAASNGKPNKALNINNFERIAQVLLTAGANPLGIIEEGINRLDDSLDLEKFLPELGGLVGAPGAGGQPGGAGPAAGQGGALPPNPAQAPAALPGVTA